MIHTSVHMSTHKRANASVGRSATGNWILQLRGDTGYPEVDIFCTREQLLQIRDDINVVTGAGEDDAREIADKGHDPHEVRPSDDPGNRQGEL